MSAVFDGTGATYLTRAALDASKTYPFWVGIWCQLVRNPVYDTVYCMWSSERSDESQGTNGFSYRMNANANAESGGTNDYASSAESIIPDPYWDHVLFEFRSSTDRRVWINNVQEGTNAVSHPIDLSAGTPLTRVGVRASGIQPFKGKLADFTVGTGIISDADRAILATPGVSYSGITGITNWYPLLSNGNDSVGSANLTAVSMTWDAADSPTARADPTQADLIQYTFKQSTLRSETPTILTGQSSPISSITNLSSVEYVDCAFTGSAGAWNTRMYHFIPTVSASHLVIVDGGHEFQSDWGGYNLDGLVRQLVAAHYAVLLSQMPGFSPSDPTYTGGPVDHDDYWASLSPTVNPLERFMGCHSIALNNLAARYTKVSMTGLSGGGWLCATYPALDPRINHASIPIRGTIAFRRRSGNWDFEQMPKAINYSVESLWPLIVRNCRLWFCNHPQDPVIGAQINTAAVGNGAYIAAQGYIQKFLCPLLNNYALADVQFFEDQGAAAHQITQWCIDNVVMPALATAKITSIGPSRGLALL